MPNVNAYFTWASLANQSATTINTATPIKNVTVNPTSGAGTITLANASTNATFTVTNTAVYEVTFSVTVANTGSDALVDVWALKAGVAL